MNGTGKRGDAGKLRKVPESEGTVFERYRKAREECRKAKERCLNGIGKRGKVSESEGRMPESAGRVSERCRKVKFGVCGVGRVTVG